MRSVGLKILKNKLSEYVRIAAAGETVIVTDRDRIVAELVPPRAGRSAILADVVMADAVRQGLIALPARPAGEAPPRKPVLAFRDLMRDLEHDRGDR